MIIDPSASGASESALGGAFSSRASLGLGTASFRAKDVDLNDFEQWQLNQLNQWNPMVTNGTISKSISAGTSDAVRR